MISGTHNSKTAGPKPERFHNDLRYNVLTEMFGTFASQQGLNSVQINRVWNSLFIASFRQHSDSVHLRVFIFIAHIWFDNSPPDSVRFSAQLPIKATSVAGTACVVWAVHRGVVWHIGQVWPEPTSLWTGVMLCDIWGISVSMFLCLCLKCSFVLLFDPNQGSVQVL